MLSNTPGLAAPSFRLQRGCACYQGLGRPGRIAVRIRGGVVRIHITRGTRAISSIAAKTQADSGSGIENTAPVIIIINIKTFACADTASFLRLPE